VGQHRGKYYSVNVPLKDGIDDEAYVALFKPVMAKVMEMYQPDAVVFQSGADSLTGDRLGCFNLSIRGHGECLKYMQTFGVPLLVLGGGGYTIRNVARCWTYETGCLLGHDLENKLPVNDYSEYFGPTHELQIAPSNMENQNTPEYLQGVLNKILENLSKIPPKPSVPFHDVPPDAIDPDSIGRVKEDPDQKGGGAEAEAARRSDPRELEPEDGDRDDKPSRHDASAKEEADGEKKVKEEKVEGAEAVKAELGQDAADAKDPEDAETEAADAGKDAMDVDEEAKSPGKGAGIMASDHGDQ
jgi:histone deacetylase 1/2